MKRARSEEGLVLGATELAATLNGDDPVAILNCLRKFVKIVQRERRLALTVHQNGADSDEGKVEEDSGSSDDDESAAKADNSEKGPPLKKSKKTEAWKEDTAAYNVPFVGTSVSAKDTGVIVKGQWPTGLLREYLSKSPRAVEFTSDTLIPGTDSSNLHKTLLRQKKGKLSHNIYKHYLRALRELITAAIPPNQATEKEHDIDPKWTAFIKEIVKKRLVGLWTLLREETGNGKGKAGTVQGGCGRLACYALQVAANLAKTSSESARALIRSMEQFQRGAESLWRFLLRPKLPSEGNLREESRCAALHFVAALANTEDLVVLGTICSPGARDRKISSGILFLALKEICPIPPVQDALADEREEIVEAQANLLMAMRRLVTNSLTFKSPLSDLLTKDILQMIGKLAACAPALPQDATYAQVLEASDEYPDVSGLEDAIEARRLLYTLLNPHESAGPRSNLQLPGPTIVRSLVQITTDQVNLEAQRFVLKCLNANQTLILPFLQLFSTHQFKEEFAMLAQINFLSKIVKDTPLSLVGKGSNALDADGIAFRILPLKKQTIAKYLQSSNGVIVTQTLYFLTFSLQTYASLRKADSEHALSGVEASLVAQIPDIHIFIKVQNRQQNETEKRNNYLQGCIHRFLLRLFDTFPSLLMNVKIDPAKVLPTNGSVLSSLSAFTQSNLLQIFCLLTEHAVENKIHGIDSLRMVLYVMMTTKNKKVYDVSRKAAITFISSFFAIPSLQNNEQQQCQRYEISCWIDGLSKHLVEEFCDKVLAAGNLPVRGTLEILRSWEKNGNGQVQFSCASPILIFLLKEYRSVSTRLRRLTLQVAAKGLLYQVDPLSLASSIAHNVGSLEEVDAESRQLATYASTLLRPFQQSVDEPLEILRKSMKLLFAPKSSIVKAVEGSNTSMRFEDAGEMTRSIGHFALVAWPGTEIGNRYMKSFRKWTILFTLCSRRNKDMLLFLRQYKNKAANWILCNGIFLDFILLLPGNGEMGSHQRTQDQTIFLKSLSSDKALSTYGSRQSIASGCLMTPLLDPKYKVDSLVKLASILSNKKSGSAHKFISAIANVQALNLDAKRDEMLWSQENAIVLFDVWHNMDVTNHKNMARTVHCFLAQLVAEDSTVSAFLLTRMQSVPPEKIVRRAIEYSQVLNESEVLLVFFDRLLHADHNTYSSTLADIFMDSESNQVLRTMFEEGVLDDILQSLLLVDNDELSTIFLWTVFQGTSSRILSGKGDDGAVKLLNRTMTIRNASQIFKKAHSGILGCLERICQNQQQRKRIGALAILDLCCTYLELRMESETAPESTMGQNSREPTFLSSLAVLIEKEIKHSKKTSPSQTAVLVGRFCGIVNSTKDLKGFVVGTETIHLLVRRCMKIGLASLQSPEHPASVSALRMLRTLLACEDSKWLESFGQENRIPFSAVLLRLSVSHSNFSMLLSADDPECYQQKLELVHLLFSCLQASDDQVLPSHAIKELQKSSSGGMSEFDSVIRSILRICASRSSKLIYLDELVWKDAQCSTQVSGNAWDWLPGSLKHFRINATLKLYPVHDDITTEKSGAQDAWLHAERNYQKDDRYSPGFLLPMLLDSLESLVGELEYPLATRKLTPGEMQFVLRLCDAGGLAISLAGLCSNSTTIRKISFSVLFLFTQIMHSQSAREMTNWRERPQICLLLDSVQRALAIHRADPERKSVGGSEESVLPSVNPLAAIFLARASMILMRPGDDMYPAINRYFLRIQGEHGAFQDLNRPPDFISLFCTSAEDPKQAQVERLFSLEVLRDSFLDERCWKPVRVCYAPDLVMSTISMRLGTDCDEQAQNKSQHAREIELLLSVLIRFLRFGGMRAKSFLVTRTGLLFWIAAVVQGRPMTVFECNRSCGFLFLRLIDETLSATMEIEDENWIHAVSGLPLAVCQLWNAIASGSETWNFTSEGIGSEPVSALLTRLLLSFKKVDFPVFSSSSEYTLPSALLSEILSKTVWQDETHRVDMLVGVTALRISRGTPLDDRTFVEKVLELTHASDPPEDALMCILEKVKWFATQHPSFIQNDNFVKVLCGVRPLSCRYAKTRDLWNSIYATEKDRAFQ